MVRDGRLYARGASDDKGNFLPLLHVACAMAAAGELPVHVRVLVEGEEERAGEAVKTWVREDPRGADVAIVFDSGMPDPETPAITVGLRGLVTVSYTHLRPPDERRRALRAARSRRAGARRRRLIVRSR